jgi:hypothetical protein
MVARIDADQTFAAIFRALECELRPIHYNEAHDRFVVPDWSDHYGSKTNRREKLRQMFSEVDRGIHVHDGYLYVNAWFELLDPSLFSPPPLAANRMNEDEHFAAGVDLGRRWSHLHDHFSDSGTPWRQHARYIGAKIEKSVQHYFARRWPEYYRPASNDGDYKRGAPDDFTLELPQGSLIVDVKRWNTDFDTVQARSPKPKVIYLFAEWNEREKRADMHGFLRSNSDAGSGLQEFPANEMHNIRRLIVLLNMTRLGLSYTAAQQSFMARRKEVA